MTDTMLEPCPFCEGTSQGVKDDGKSAVESYRYYVICNDCWAQGPVTKSASRAVEEWNARRAPTPLAAPTGVGKTLPPAEMIRRWGIKRDEVQP